MAITPRTARKIRSHFDSTTMKKKIESHFDSMTLSEAAALWVIYSHEARSKKQKAEVDPGERLPDDYAIYSYAPIYRLLTQWKPADQNDQGRLQLMIEVAKDAREYGQKNLWRLMYRATKLIGALDLIYSLDILKTIASSVVGLLLPNIPKPVTPDEWSYLVDWAEEDLLGEVEAFARHIVDEDLEAEGRKRDSEGAWAGVEGDRLEALRAKQRDRLIKLIKAGDLAGGLGVWPAGWAAYSLIVDGKIPGLAALRNFWPIWLRDHDFFLANAPTIDEVTPAGWHEIHTAANGLSPEEIMETVDRFFADARKTRWGQTLTKPFGMQTATLASLIMQAPTPLLLASGDVVGLVDWQTFRTSHEDFDATPVWLVRIGSLRANARLLGLNPARFHLLGIFGDFYPDHEARDARATIGAVVNMLTSIQFSDAPPFTYAGRRRSPGFVGGLDIFTPLEECVRKLGEVFGEVATYKAILRTLSDEFYLGVDLVDADTVADLKALEDDLAKAEATVRERVARLKAWPWNIEDTSALELKKAGVDEEEVSREVGRMAFMISRDKMIDTTRGALKDATEAEK